jgi:hypothetical protein
MKDERTKELDALLNSSEADDKKDDKKEEPGNKDKEKKIDELSDKKDEKAGKEKLEEKKEKDDEEEKSDNENDDDDEEKSESEEDKENEEDDEENSDDEDKDEDLEDEEEVEEDAGGEASKQKDKWHGKSREEVIRLYEDLEKKSQPKQLEKTQDKPAKEKAETGEEEFDVPSDEELAKMTPKQFAQWMVIAVKNIVGKTYDEKTKLRDSVAQEIRDAQKDHPLLKTSPEYRELVLSLIENASQKGKALSLKDACAKVDGFTGTVKGDSKVSEAEKTRLKKAKAQVERGAGAPTSPVEEKGAEEKRLEQIFGTSRFKGPLGGLGV